jgi:hypothetical protein
MDDDRINWPGIPLKHLRDHILGDDDLMWYCLEETGRAAIEKGMRRAESFLSILIAISLSR